MRISPLRGLAAANASLLASTARRHFDGAFRQDFGDAGLRGLALDKRAAALVWPRAGDGVADSDAGQNGHAKMPVLAHGRQ